MARLALLLSLTAVVSPMAMAQGATNRSPGLILPEVVVTADPLARPAEELAAPALVLNAPVLRDRAGQAGLGSTLDAVPGVASTAFGAGASRPIIRGLGEDRIRVLSAGLGQADASSVSPDHAVPTEGFEATTIELIRGPAALAFGGNAIGGVVNVIDQRIAETLPEQALTWQVGAGLTTGLDAADGAFGLTATTGPLVWRAEGFARDAGDFAVPGFAFSPAKRAEEIAEGVDPAEFARGTVPNSFAEAQSGAVGVSYVGDWGFVGVAVRQVDQLYGITGAGKEEKGGGEPAIFAGPRIDLRQTRTELRAGWSDPLPLLADVRLSAAYGDYEHAELEESGEVGTVFTNTGTEARLTARTLWLAGGAIGISGSRNDIAAVGAEAFLSPTETRDIGIFALQRIGDDRLSAEFGGRLEQREHDNIRFGTRQFDLASVAASLRFAPAAGVVFTAGLARTERAPTETELFADGPHLATGAFEIGDPDLAEETALSLDAGVAVTSDRFSAALSLFAIDFTDYVALLATGAEEDDLPVFAFAARDAQFYGGEITARYMVYSSGSRRLALDAALDLVQAELSGGGNLPRIPPASLTLGVEGGAGPYTARFEWVGTQEADRLAAFETPTDGSSVLNAQLRWDGMAGTTPVALVLDGRNLTDEDVRAHTSFTKDLVPQPGRAVRLGLRAGF
jgi:iron complex outermembrane receptor protein